jgi:signal recognition particle GTPase
MSGLQGSGKTTFSENWPISLKKRIKPLLVACDITVLRNSTIIRC